MKRRSNKLSQDEIKLVKARKVDDEPAERSYSEMVELFLQDARLRNLRPHTLRYYTNELMAFRQSLEALGHDITPIKIKLSHINSVIKQMQEAGRKVGAINARLRAVRSFFNFAYKHGHIKVNPCRDLKLLKGRREVVETFTGKQIKEILDAPDLKTFTGVRDYTFLLLLLETGVRASELVGIHISDIKWDDSVILIRNTKGHRERFVPFQRKMEQQLKRYLEIRGRCDTDALFVTLDGTPISKRQVQNRITYYGDFAGIKGVRCSCHTFRHTFAKLCVKQGAGIFELQQILGHTSMEMVRIYVNLYSNDVKDKHKQFSPLKYVK